MKKQNKYCRLNLLFFIVLSNDDNFESCPKLINSEIAFFSSIIRSKSIGFEVIKKNEFISIGFYDSYEVSTGICKTNEKSIT
jgi:hypothetical protein